MLNMGYNNGFLRGRPIESEREAILRRFAESLSAPDRTVDWASLGRVLLFADAVHTYPLGTAGCGMHVVFPDCQIHVSLRPRRGLPMRRVFQRMDRAVNRAAHWMFT